MSRALTELFGEATRFLFFTGKGGVGKTSLACTTAVALADSGRRVLLVSTDPASNLDEVLGQRLSNSAVPIGSVERLYGMNINPAEAAQVYRERIVGPFRGKLPEAALRSMEEQLSGACTTEIAAFDEFTRLLGDPAATAEFDHVILDTAPTGHTLRLLALPAAWTTFMSNNTTGNSCLGPVAGLQSQRAFYERTVAVLGNATQTTLVLVTRPQAAALDEVERTSRELAALGLRNQKLIVNGVFRAGNGRDPVAAALERRGAASLRRHDQFLGALPVYEVPLRPHNLVGVPALRAMAAGDGAPAPVNEADTPASLPRKVIPLARLIDELAVAGRGVILTMGKGGVGKTTIAGAIATELARRGHSTHLSTTDPAAHVAQTVGTVPNLTVSRIDPAAETRAYTEDVLETVGRNLDPQGRALLEEDLRSPCSEEIAVFRAFARIVAGGEGGFVVLDTAPTGHTLLLLDATEAYHREVSRQASDLPEEVRTLLPRLRDPNYTKVLLVTLPEPTPVHEAEALQQDLRRAQIEPFAWVINQSFAEVETADPLLQARGRAEIPLIQEVQDLSAHVALVPWGAQEPVGAAALQALL